jgi:putative endonuclease
MPHYVYIIQSLIDFSFYKGYSADPAKRLKQHNEGDCHYTSAKTPWKLVYVELCNSKSEALKREKALKKYSNSQIENLIVSPKNILKKFFPI